MVYRGSEWLYLRCGDSSYLACGHELERAESGLHVGDVALEVVEGIGDAGLDLRGGLPRWAVWRDLVQGGGRHGGWRCGLKRDEESISSRYFRIRGPLWEEPLHTRDLASFCFSSQIVSLELTR